VRCLLLIRLRPSVVNDQEHAFPSFIIDSCPPTLGVVPAPSFSCWVTVAYVWLGDQLGRQNAG
jgi:hypothetical protein